MTTIIRAMTVEDYDQLHALWMRIKGFGIRSIDDSKEGVERFLKRNPTTSVIAEIDGKVVGGILCGDFGIRMFLSCMCRSGVPLSWDRKEHGCLCNVSSERGTYQQDHTDRIYQE